jgi:S-layer protein (TIGR01567 family)
LCLLPLVVVILLFVLSSAASAQTEEAFVRGHFSGGDGTWNPKDFGWFYYDLDEDVGGESLSVDLDGKLAEKNHIIYASKVFSSDFNFKPWGCYETIAFLGKPYLAGYPDCNLTDAASFLEKGELRLVLIDNDDTHTLTTNESLPLLGGYEIVLDGISKSGKEASFVLFKNGKPVDASIVSIGGTYVFKIDDIPVILIHLANALSGGNYGTAEIDGIFQVSDSPAIYLSDGAKIDNMKLTDISKEGLEFRNDVDLDLNRDIVVPLLDGLTLVVTDNSQLVYYPQGAITDYGIHEIRGPVYSDDSAIPVFNYNTGEVVDYAKARWDCSNFSGFFFDPEDNLGGEELIIHNLSGRDIKPYDYSVEKKKVISGMEYVAPVQPTEFGFKPWGKYYVIGFLGQPWFVGYGPNTKDEIGNISTIAQAQIHQLLLDLGEQITIDAGRSLPLQDGYSLTLLSVSNDKASAQLRKGGVVVESPVLRPNSTYIYKEDVGDINDLPVIAIHVQNVFEGDPERDAQRMVVDGIFQISDRYYTSVDRGNDYGEFTIVASNPNYILMVNPDTISLDRDSSQGIWYGMSIKVADNDTLRYYLYTPQYVVPKPELTRFNYPRNIPSGSYANFTMLVRAGEIRMVSAAILDPNGRSVYEHDITEQKAGSGENWIFGYRWNATVLRLSDDGGQVLDSNLPIPALLFTNQSGEPVKVWILFDASGRITTMMDGDTSYYISPYGLRLVNSNLSYEDMLQNETARREYIKIEPGKSTLQFFDYINGSARLNSTNHTLSGSLESLEPHVVHAPAKQGRYEILLRIENAVNVLNVNGYFFNVTAPEVRGVLLGNSAISAGNEASVASVPVAVPRSGGEKRINISYDPAVVEAVGVSGSCDVPSYIDPEGGRIGIVMPANCSSTNLTFRVLNQTIDSNANVTTKVKVIDVKGFQPEGITNGSITVITANNTTGEAPKSSAPAFIMALAAFALAAFAWRRREG